MTEYRVVATRDEEDLTGKKWHIEAGACIWDGHAQRFTTTNKGEAERFLELAKIECAKYDAKTQTSTIRYTQTNIRIQTREVTEWK